MNWQNRISLAWKENGGHAPNSAAEIVDVCPQACQASKFVISKTDAAKITLRMSHFPDRVHQGKFSTTPSLSVKCQKHVRCSLGGPGCPLWGYRGGVATEVAVIRPIGSQVAWY